MRESTVCFLAAVLTTVVCGCVRSSYVRERSRDIGELSREIRTDVDVCRQVYDRVKSAAAPVATNEPCQAPASAEAKERAKPSKTAEVKAIKESEAVEKAYEDGRRSVPTCTASCEEAQRKCQHALSQIDRVIDAAGELQRRAH